MRKKRAVVKSALVDLSAGVVVVEVHERTRRVAALGAPLARVHERLGERRAVGDVVGTAGPLEAVVGGGGGRRRVARRVDRAVAAAAVEEARAAGARHGVCDSGRRDGVHERRLTGTCNRHTDTSRSALARCHPTQ